VDFGVFPWNLAGLQFCSLDLAWISSSFAGFGVDFNLVHGIWRGFLFSG